MRALLSLAVIFAAILLYPHRPLALQHQPGGGTRTMTSHEKECALAALALLIEQAKKHNRPTLALRRHYRKIADTQPDDENETRAASAD